MEKKGNKNSTNGNKRELQKTWVHANKFFCTNQAKNQWKNRGTKFKSHTIHTHSLQLTFDTYLCTINQIILILINKYKSLLCMWQKLVVHIISFFRGPCFLPPPLSLSPTKEQSEFLASLFLDEVSVYIIYIHSLSLSTKEREFSRNLSLHNQERERKEGLVFKIS